MRVFRDEEGQTLIYVALFLGIVGLGCFALAVDAGYLFQEKRLAQAAADAAAVAAAEEGGSGTNAQNAANVAATMNGFNTKATTNPAVVTLTTSSTGNYSSTLTTVPTNWVTASVTMPVNTFFLGAFKSGMKTLNIGASATASGGSNASDCVCLLGTTGMDLNMSNGAHFTGSSCGIKVDSTSSSSIGVIGGANLCPKSIGTVASSWNDAQNGSNVNNGGAVCSTATVVQSVSACSVAMPNVPVDTTCSADPSTLLSGGGVSYTVGPGSTYGTTESGNTICYNALTVNGNGDTATLNAGIYVINGGELHFNSGGPNLGGSGVVFYLTNGANLVIDNGANVNLTAMSSGTYSGILIYQDPGYPAASNDATSDTGDSQAISIQGGSSVTFNGAIYAPLAVVTLGNGSGTTFTANIVAQSLTMDGGGSLTGSPNAALGSVTSGGGAYLAQ